MVGSHQAQWCAPFDAKFGDTKGTVGREQFDALLGESMVGNADGVVVLVIVCSG